MASISASLQHAFDQSPLNASYWKQFAFLTSCTAIDFFDYFIAGFLVSVVAPLWKLTYLQSGVILLAAGVGSMVGSLAGGLLADKFGRKNVIIIGAILAGISSGAVAFLPDNAWQMFAFLRFMTGAFISGVFVATIVLVTELTPTRYRTSVATLSFVAPSLGILLATFTSAMLLESLGWRGVALIAVAPALLGLFGMFFLHESPLWLMSNGDEDSARHAVSLRTGMSTEGFTFSVIQNRKVSGGYAELFFYPRRLILVSLIWFGIATAAYGVYAWGPTIVSLAQQISPQAAARQFLWVSCAGVTGKVVFSFVANRIGRKPAGIITSGVGLTFLAIAGQFHAMVFLGLPVFVLALAISVFFFEGGTAGASPYSAEVFPVRLAARGAGLGQFASGIGKIIGPLSLALIAGSDNVVSPSATEAAITPGFLFMAGCLGLTFLAYAILGIETHGKQLQIDEVNRDARAEALTD